MSFLYKFFIALFFVIVVQNLAVAQASKEELSRQKQQLQREIDQLNNRLKSLSGNKQKALDLLRAINAKVDAREDLIKNINKDIKRLDEDLFYKEREIYRLKKELDTLKIKYGQSIVFAHKNRSNYQYLNFLFASKDFNDAMKRVTYLKSYRALRETEAQNITKTQDLLQGTVKKLGESKQEKNNALTNQNEQLKVLEQDKKQKDQAVKEIKGQEREVQEQLRKREKERIALNNAINAAIKREIAEAERRERERIAKIKAAEAEKRRRLEAEAQAAKIAVAKAKAEADAKAKADAKEKADAEAKAKAAEAHAKKVDEDLQKANDNIAERKGQIVNGKKREYNVLETKAEDLQSSLNFESKRGSLPWPVATGEVTGKFGIAVLGPNLREQHDGIFITTNVGSAVKSVAAGTVTMVLNMEEFYCVGIRHGKYTTFYNRINNPSVSVGQQVGVGAVLGKVAQSDKGDGELEFRIVNGDNKYMNPENWLYRR